MPDTTLVLATELASAFYVTKPNKQIKEVKKNSSTYVHLVGEGPLWRWHGSWYLKNDKELVRWKWAEEHFKQKRGLDQKPKTEKNWTRSKHEQKTSMRGSGKERRLAYTGQGQRCPGLSVREKDYRTCFQSAITNSQLNVITKSKWKQNWILL